MESDVMTLNCLQMGEQGQVFIETGDDCIMHYETWLTTRNYLHLTFLENVTPLWFNRVHALPKYAL